MKDGSRFGVGAKWRRGRFRLHDRRVNYFAVLVQISTVISKYSSWAGSGNTPDRTILVVRQPLRSAGFESFSHCLIVRKPIMSNLVGELNAGQPGLHGRLGVSRTRRYTVPVCTHVGFFRSMRKIHRIADATNGSEKHLQEPESNVYSTFSESGTLSPWPVFGKAVSIDRRSRIVP